MMPILPVRQKAHFIAQPTCVERQNVCARRVGNEDRLDQLPVLEPQQELGGAVGRPLLLRTTSGVATWKRLGSSVAQLAAEVGHAAQNR